MLDNNQFPKISVVTPTFNQGQYIEETILSVIGQCYPNLEYIIIDGGSTDNTVEIIKKYERHITYWISEKDKGQSHAINKGFARATGDIIAWLNSDDLYMPNSLNYISKKINTSETGIYFGNCLHFKEGHHGITSWGSDVDHYFKFSLLENVDYIIQPSTFWTKKTWAAVGNLQESSHYAFDWEWFLRAKQKGIKFYSLNKCLSMYRIHEDHKTGTGGAKRQQEILKMLNNYSVKYARLYEMLINENIKDSALDIRITRKLLSLLKKPNSIPDILKILKHSRYKEYTTVEIARSILML